MYKKILVAIDLSKDSQKVVDAAVRVACIAVSDRTKWDEQNSGRKLA
ncbi:MAG: universal stress protein [Proteobacteria bacterium]|nr:universal stress protein [Pseudomonadota bacterium]